jgi:hypothetical protein
MSALTVYLADLKGVEWPSPIRRRLQDHFDTVVKAHKTITSASVEYTSRAPKLRDYDLLVYFVDSPSDSVIKYLGGIPDADATGWTKFGHSQMACEVYIGRVQDDPEGIANLAFHELMHIKSNMDDKKLHNTRGLSMGRWKVTADTPLNKGDIDLMVKHLTTKRNLWTGGFTYYHDPLR